jgi:putative transposase
MTTIRGRGFQPKCVLFDGWYSSLENLKLIRGFGWMFLTRLKSNRLVRVTGGPETAVSRQPISASGTLVWLPGFREIRVFQLVAPNGNATHRVTNDLNRVTHGWVALLGIARRQSIKHRWPAS